MITLKQLGNQWIFDSETELEELIWTNLKQLFGFSPLRRQHYVSEQYCDILAASDDRQLIVLELKNKEDRYIVQQLTRYYDALKREKPYQDQVDYSKSIRLIAITPSFHRDNLIDREYNTLRIEFIKFDILIKNNQFIWSAQDIDNQNTWKLNIPYKHEESNIIIPPVPRKLLNWLSDFDEDRRTRILAIRENFLSFNHQVEEIVNNTSILYGKGNNKSCAEFRVDSKKQNFTLFLWLPHPSRKHLTRMIVYTKDWLTLNNFSYASPNYKLMDETLMIYKFLKVKSTINITLLDQFKDNWRDIAHEWYNPSQIIKVYPHNYQKLIENPDQYNSLDLFIEIALEKWLARLS
jgi:RecB family endonuclease NucS